MEQKLFGIIKKFCNFSILQSCNKRAGFTLVELLVVMAMTTIIAVISFNNISGYRDSQDVRGAGQQIAAALRDAQNRSMSGEGNGNWGVHFDNTTSTSPFYVVVSGTAYSSQNIFFQVAVPAGILFTGLPSGSSLDVFFSSLTGRPASTTILTVGKNSSSKGGISDVLIKDSGQISSSYDSGLAGYWHFDEGSGTTTIDASGYGDTGNLINSPTWQTNSNCKSGSCLSFTNNYLSFGTPQSLSFNRSFTISAWVKSNNVTSPQYQTIVNHGSQNSKGEYWLYLTNGKISLEVSDGVTHPYNENLSSAIDTNFHHIVVTFNSGSVKSYLDGAPVTTASYSVSDILAGDQSFRIGSYTGSSHFFNGIIDEVRVYNRVLSAAEILSQYNALK